MLEEAFKIWIGHGGYRKRMLRPAYPLPCAMVRPACPQPFSTAHQPQLSNRLYPRNDDIEKRNIEVLIVNRDCLYLIAGICVLAVIDRDFIDHEKS